MKANIEHTLGKMTSVCRCPGRPSETRDPETGETVRLKCESTITVVTPSKREANAAIRVLMNEKGWSVITTLGESHALCKGCVSYAAGKSVAAKKVAAKKVAAAKVAAANKVAAAKVVAAEKVATDKAAAAEKAKQATFLWGRHATPTDNS